MSIYKFRYVAAGMGSCYGSVELEADTLDEAEEKAYELAVKVALLEPSWIDIDIQELEEE